MKKLKYRKRDRIIQSFCKIGSRREVMFPLFNFKRFLKSVKSAADSCTMHWNLMNDKEFGSFKLLKLKCRRVDQIVQLFCRIGSTQEVRSPLIYLKFEKSAADSCRTHWNLMNDKEFESFKLLKLKCRRSDQIIQLFYIIDSVKEVRSPLVYLNLRKVLLNHVELTEI